MKIQHGKSEQPVTLDEALANLTAPRVTEDSIDQKIEKAECLVFPGTTLTICCITLKNGFHVIGTADCVSPENFNQEIGIDIATKDARDKIWQLEGYLLREKLYQGSHNPTCSEGNEQEESHD